MQKTRERFEARLVVERDLAGDEKMNSIAWIQERLGHPFQIDCRREPEIPRHAGGRYEYFICEIASD